MRPKNELNWLLESDIVRTIIQHMYIHISFLILDLFPFFTSSFFGFIERESRADKLTTPTLLLGIIMIITIIIIKKTTRRHIEDIFPQN